VKGDCFVVLGTRQRAGDWLAAALGYNFNILILILAFKNNFDTGRTAALGPSWESCTRDT
jgi:hypothetical protein